MRFRTSPWSASQENGPTQGTLSSPASLVPQSAHRPHSPNFPPHTEKPFSVRLETLAHLWDLNPGPIATVFAVICSLLHHLWTLLDVSGPGRISHSA